MLCSEMETDEIYNLMRKYLKSAVNYTHHLKKAFKATDRLLNTF